MIGVAVLSFVFLQYFLYLFQNKANLSKLSFTGMLFIVSFIIRLNPCVADYSVDPLDILSLLGASEVDPHFVATCRHLSSGSVDRTKSSDLGRLRYPRVQGIRQEETRMRRRNETCKV